MSPPNADPLPTKLTKFGLVVSFPRKGKKAPKKAKFSKWALPKENAQKVDLLILGGAGGGGDYFVKFWGPL